METKKLTIFGFPRSGLGAPGPAGGAANALSDAGRFPARPKGVGSDAVPSIRERSQFQGAQGMEEPFQEVRPVPFQAGHRVGGLRSPAGRRVLLRQVEVMPKGPRPRSTAEAAPPGQSLAPKERTARILGRAGLWTPSGRHHADTARDGNLPRGRHGTSAHYVRLQRGPVPNPPAPGASSVLATAGNGRSADAGRRPPGPPAATPYARQPRQAENQRGRTAARGGGEPRQPMSRISMATTRCRSPVRAGTAPWCPRARRRPAPPPRRPGGRCGGRSPGDELGGLDPVGVRVPALAEEVAQLRLG